MPVKSIQFIYTNTIHNKILTITKIQNYDTLNNQILKMYINVYKTKQHNCDELIFRI